MNLHVCMTLILNINIHANVSAFCIITIYHPYTLCISQFGRVGIWAYSLSRRPPKTERCKLWFTSCSCALLVSWSVTGSLKIYTCSASVCYYCLYIMSAPLHGICVYVCHSIWYHISGITGVLLNLFVLQFVGLLTQGAVLQRAVEHLARQVLLLAWISS